MFGPHHIGAVGLPTRGPDGKPWQLSDSMQMAIFGRQVPGSIDVLAYFRSESSRLVRLMAEAPPPVRRGDVKRAATHTTAYYRELLANIRRRDAEHDGRWSIALHEAGHAWCSWHVGAGPGITSIMPDEARNGYHEFWNLDLAPRQRLQLYLAGPMAAWFAVRRSFTGFEFAWCDRGDRRAIDDVIRRTKGGKAIYREAMARCKESIPRNWAKIDAIARELIACSFITRDTLKRICESN